MYRGVSKETRDKLTETQRTLGFVPDIINSITDLSESLGVGRGTPADVVASVLAKKSGMTKEEVTKASYDKVYEGLESVYEFFYGEQNIELIEQGGRKVPVVKQPRKENYKRTIRGLGELAALIAGPGKAKVFTDPKNPKKAKTFYQKYIKPSAKTKNATLAGLFGNYQ